LRLPNDARTINRILLCITNMSINRMLPATDDNGFEALLDLAYSDAPVSTLVPVFQVLFKMLLERPNRMALLSSRWCSTSLRVFYTHRAQGRCKVLREFLAPGWAWQSGLAPL
jgi:hypothetical protein